MYVCVSARYLHYLHSYITALCYICNMGRRDLPDMYARARGRTYQANPDRTCYICYVTLPALYKSAELA